MNFSGSFIETAQIKKKLMDKTLQDTHLKLTLRGKTMLRHTILAQGPILLTECFSINKKLPKLKYENKLMKC